MEAMSRARLLVLASAVATVPWLARADEPAELEKTHRELAAPFLKKHCLGCHDQAHREGDTVLEPLVEAGAHERSRELWKNAAERVALRQMPPDEEPQPSDADRAAFVAWVRRATASDQQKPAQQDPGRVTVRRLNRAEYDYTVQDLLG